MIKKNKAKHMSQMLIKTLREAPADAELASHALLVRAGMMKQLASGIYSYMPMLYRTLRKVEQILREEMDSINGQELNMPVAHSADLWKESGRYQADISEMLKFKDRNNRDMVLAMTHEEVVTDIVRSMVGSYKQLPIMLYHIQTKFRDEPRARGGLIRVREFVMKDAYSFHTNKEDLDQYYEQVAEAYFNIYNRAGLDDVVKVAGDSGMMGGNESHEYMFVTESGEDRLVICRSCGYAANMEVATQQKQLVNEKDKLQEMQEVHTPNAKEIAQVAEFLGVNANQTIKTLIYKVEDELVLIALRGDMHLNDKKLAFALKTDKFRPAKLNEVAEAGLVAGYVSPVGIKGFKVIADDVLTKEMNLVAGANKVDYHLKNVNLGRDFTADIVTDIVEVKEGALCSECGHTVEHSRGIEVGNIFKLGTKYTEAFNATFADADGSKFPIIMGCYGIGVGRLAASVVEKFHDDNGIIWPVNIAPYHVVVVPIGKQVDEAFTTAENLANELAAAGIETLFDDRKLRNGVKFKDIDLIGIPLRIVIGKKSLANNEVEVKWRNSEDKQMIAVNEVKDWAIDKLKFDVTLA